MSTWSFSAGVKPNTVTVFEREPGGMLYARAWDATARDGKGNWRRISLKHRDRGRAKRYATDQAAKLQKGESEIGEGKVTLAQVFALYKQHRTPTKKPAQQVVDNTRAELWTRILGATADPHNVSLAAWDTFIASRRSGAIDARGRAVPTDKRRSIRARRVEADCEWLRVVFNWASRWRLPSGRYLMRENPCRGYAAPKEKNPRRPVATAELFQALRTASERHMMQIRKGGRGTKHPKVRSYLPELLDIAEGTARRISAICSLRYSDLILTKTEHAPYGAIRWPAETDKRERAWSAPITPRVRAAINRILADRPGIGTGYLFPAPGTTDKPLSKRLALHWFHEAEILAGIAPEKGRGWHSLRRKWATERKHLPDVDVAAAGGWASVVALKQSYQHADPETMLSVVLGGGELREAR
jgi:hypothetical protein